MNARRVTTAAVGGMTACLVVPLLALTSPASAGPTASTVNRDQAELVLAEARTLFDGSTPSGHGRDATLVLRDLRLSRSSLTDADRAAAVRLLARPTDGDADPEGYGYSVAEATPVCGDHVCVHYVTSSADAPALVDSSGAPGGGPNGVPDYVDTALSTVEHVHSTYVAAGYRAPKSDDLSGGGPETDIYLADLGADGLYGLCGSDDPSSNPDVSAYCLLDNDYTDAAFDGYTPLQNLQVTAAHEYFHAVQFAYDFREDAWFMEATATWAEDELYDGVDQNVSYLPYGQLGKPQLALDLLGGQPVQYGNWIFFRYLTERYPDAQGGLPTLVRDMWDLADASSAGADEYSLQAIDSALLGRDISFTKTFAQFAAANRFARSSYAEGRANKYPQAKIGSKVRLTKSQRTSKVIKGRLVNQLSSYAAQATPKGLTGKWRLKVKVDLGNRSHTPVAVVDRIRRNGTHAPLAFVRLNAKGVGRLRVPFGNAATARVVVTLVSAGIQYRCWEEQPFACSGEPLDDNQPYSLRFSVSR